VPYAAVPVALAQTLALLLARLAGLFLLSPGFSQRQIPLAVRAAFTFALASIVMFSIPGLKKPLGPGPMVLAVLTQSVLGYLQGFLFAVAVEGLSSAGDILDLQVGFAFASLVDPTRDSSPHALFSRLINTIGLMVFFALGGHLWILGGMLHSIHQTPLESAAISARFIDVALIQGSGVLRSSLQMAAPVIAYLAMVDLVMMLLSKTVPQMQIMAVGFPIKILIGLSGVAWFLPNFVETAIRAFESVYRLVAGT
jgi:flagellar biosynthesis protein FliR